MPAQSDIATAHEKDKPLTLRITIGNANQGSSALFIGGVPVMKEDGTPMEFIGSFSFVLPTARELGSRKVEINSVLSPTPGIPDPTLVLTYNIDKVNWPLNKKRTLEAQPVNGSNVFDITLKVR